MTVKSQPENACAVAQIEEEEINVGIKEEPAFPFATATPAPSVAVPCFHYSNIHSHGAFFTCSS
jgi:hypothetical protein